MEHFRSFEHNAFTASHEEMRGFISISDRKDLILCPRPRRAGVSLVSTLRPLRCHISHAAEPCNSKAGMELLDLILTKEGSVVEPHFASDIASPPPFFSGSPPCRAGNPLIQDARFRYEGTDPTAALSGTPPRGLPSRLSYECVERLFRAQPAAPVRLEEGFDIAGRESKRSDTPATVRVEGFDVRNRDRANSSAPSAIRVENLDILSRDRRNSGVSAAA